MNRLLRPLRLRLAATGFAAIYVPVLILFVAALALSENVTVDVIDGSQAEVRETGSQLDRLLPLVLVSLAPVAAVLSWWWSGRAVRPVAEAAVVQQQLIEEASHELRTPLSILSTNADVLLSHPEPTAALYRQGVARSGQVAQRMADTIQALLVDARGRARTIDRRPTDLVALARRVADGVAPLAQTRRVVVRLRAPTTIRARVDRPSVERAVTNLLTNAVRHGPTGSLVDLEVASAPEAVAIVVTDRGPGIGPEEQAMIFQRYWQAGEGDGAGLGLPIVRHVAQAHGGAVTVESPVSDGRGTRFRLTLSH